MKRHQIVKVKKASVDKELEYEGFEVVTREDALAELPFVVEKSKEEKNLYRVFMENDENIRLVDIYLWIALSGDAALNIGHESCFDGKTDWNGRVIGLRFYKHWNETVATFIIDYPDDEYMPF